MRWHPLYVALERSAGLEPPAGVAAGGRRQQAAQRKRGTQGSETRKASVALPVLVPPPAALVARLPASFVEKSPRHAHEDAPKHDGDDGEGPEDATDHDEGEDSDDSIVAGLLDYMLTRGPRNDTQMRMGEHSRNWKQIESKANSELVAKIDSLREKRKQRSHSKLRVAAVTGGGADGTSSDRKARRHQALWQVNTLPPPGNPDTPLCVNAVSYREGVVCMAGQEAAPTGAAVVPAPKPSVLGHPRRDR